MNKKSVLYIRHAKSSWDHFGISDLERPLNERGNKTAPRMAELIHLRYPDSHPMILSSPAMRAIQTAKYFAIEFKQSVDNIRVHEGLYSGDESNYLECLTELSDDIELVFVFGHNPTIESLVAKFVNAYHGLVPTLSLIHI